MIALTWSERVHYSRKFETGADLLLYLGLDMDFEDAGGDLATVTESEAVQYVDNILDTRYGLFATDGPGDDPGAVVDADFDPDDLSVWVVKP